MFDSVALRRSASGAPITAGLLAEALLFYQRVYLVLDRGTLAQLLRQIGPSVLLSLLRRPDFSAVYTDEMLGTMTNTVGPCKVHDFVAFTLEGDSNERPQSRLTPLDRLVMEVERFGLSRPEARRFADKFLKTVPLRRLSGNHFLAGGVPEAAKADIADAQYTAEAIRAVLRNIPGGVDPGPNFKFDVILSALGHYVFEDLDLSSINRRRASMSPPEEAVTIAHLLSHILDARADIALAAHYGGDFMTSAATSAVVRIRYDLLLQRSQVNHEQRSQFVEIALPDMPHLSEVIDAGERRFEDFLKLLDRSDRFRSWLRSANPDEGLAREYLRAVASQDWIQTPNAKGLRYLLTLAFDQTNSIAGLVAGITDNFLVEKLLGGWRPNHFVEGRLTPFLSGR